MRPAVAMPTHGCLSGGAGAAMGGPPAITRPPHRVHRQPSAERATPGAGPHLQITMHRP